MAENRRKRAKTTKNRPRNRLLSAGFDRKGGGGLWLDGKVTILTAMAQVLPSLSVLPGRKKRKEDSEKIGAIHEFYLERTFRRNGLKRFFGGNAGSDKAGWSYFLHFVAVRAIAVK